MNFYYNLKSPVYLPFTLQYMFLLATPITAAELPMRLLSLFVAPIGIMLIQFVVNKNKTTVEVTEPKAEEVTRVVSKKNKREYTSYTQSYIQSL